MFSLFAQGRNYRSRVDTTPSHVISVVPELRETIVVEAGVVRELVDDRVADLIGEPLDRANLELLRRYVRQALKEDPRVEEVTALTVSARADLPGAVDVRASIRAITGDAVELGLALDLG